MTPPTPDSPRLVSLRWRLLIPAIVVAAIVLLLTGVIVLSAQSPDGSREAANQLLWGMLAIIGVVVLMLLVVIVRRLLDPVDRMRAVAERLAAGEMTTPTGMRPTDEIGALGHAIDRYAARVNEKQEELRASLRRQRRELEHFTAMIESLPDGIIVQDIDGHVTFINAHARQLIGEKYNYFKRAADRDITAAVAETLGGMRAPGIIAQGAPTRIALDGKVLSVSTAAIQSMLDRPIGTVLVLRDVTDAAGRDEARAALVDQVSQTWGADSTSSPSAPRPADGKADTAGFADAARRQEVEVGRLLTGLRELTHVDAQVIQRSGRPIPLETLIHAVGNEWRAVAHAANLTLDVTIEQPGLRVVGDERRLRWALGNLIDNAVKYTPPGGKVTIQVKGADAGYARVRIRDTGAGIAPGDQPRIFERFFRAAPVLDNGRAIEVPGTGLGLSIARDLITAHGGTIIVRSTPGVGTAVYLTLPLEGTPLPAAAPIEDEDD
ncbi:MAG: ATP-binding protein [Chloroflexota bacterium]|nr:ATP-binding protein [Chloroflexota bacterium]